MTLDKSIIDYYINKDFVPSRPEIIKKFKLSDTDARFYRRLIENKLFLSAYFVGDKELIESSVKFKKQTQRLNDINRIERKSFREYARVENAISEYSKGLLDVFKRHSLLIKTTAHEYNNNSVGVIHISDTHFNELVELSTNRYDFTIASKRMMKLVKDSIKYLKYNNVTSVVFAMTGDLLNSDRRLDELLSESTNRSKATFLAVQILENMILELNEHFNVVITSVTGNESRVGKDVGWVNNVASDSYDLTIYRVLEYILKDKDGISFVGGDGLVSIIDIAGYNWLFIHGHQQGFNTNPSQAVSKLVRLYADKGINIRYVAFGHIHEAMIADMYARNSSTVGSNSYSENALMLTSRASQNVYIQHSNGNIDSIKIDLQDYSGFDGYPIQKELEAYNAKSASKSYTGETIFKVVI